LDRKLECRPEEKKMKIYVRDFNCKKKYFDTLNDAVKFIRRYSKPNGKGYTLWVEDSTGVHRVGFFRKDGKKLVKTGWRQ
jgi:hypothetical protein